jgi:exosome complex exonuclease RRP6
LSSRISKVPRNLDIPKPQRRFEHVPTNDEKAAFKPLLTSKPHAISPLEQSLSHRERNIQTGTLQYDNQFYISEYKTSPLPIQKLIDSIIRYDHPYKTEIERYSYPQSVYEIAEPVMYHPFETTTATNVDTVEALAEMLIELKKASEIAIDLEHHDTRSFVGIVSLMQISTRDQDWIVDTLKPWRRRLECLNEVFADPKILKVVMDCTDIT